MAMSGVMIECGKRANECNDSSMVFAALVEGLNGWLLVGWFG
jgi:hypothetical protein